MSTPSFLKTMVDAAGGGKSQFWLALQLAAYFDLSTGDVLSILSKAKESPEPSAELIRLLQLASDKQMDDFIREMFY